MLSGSGSPSRRSSLSSATLRYQIYSALFPGSHKFSTGAARAKRYPTDDGAVHQQLLPDRRFDRHAYARSTGSREPMWGDDRKCPAGARQPPCDPASFGLNANGLNGALSQLNGGAELGVPTSQASIVQTTQTSRQTGAIEERLKELRDWTTGTAVAGAELPRTGTSRSIEHPGSRRTNSSRAKPAARICLFDRPVRECSPMGLVSSGAGT